LAYLVSNQSTDPDLAVALIAKATTDEANTRHAINSTHLGILKSQADYEPYTQDPFLSDVLYMLDYTTFLPNNPNWGPYSTITYEALAAVQSGDLTAQEAVDLVVEGLQNELGDEIIIR
jgi:inositol-phosphate transport system substrate-binding protein